MAGCLNDPDEPTRRSLQFDFLRFPGQMMAGHAPGSVDVEYYVGPSGCWRVESIGLDLSGNTITISGTSRDYSGGNPCTSVVVYGQDTLVLPALRAGTYLVIAGSLVDTLVVTDSVLASDTIVVARGSASVTGDNCGELYGGPVNIGLTDIPDSLSTEVAYFHGIQIGPDQYPCDLPYPDYYEVYMSVRRIETMPG